VLSTGGALECRLRFKANRVGQRFATNVLGALTPYTDGGKYDQRER
jgi:hypothetical protein